jgi:hypothetical protein
LFLKERSSRFFKKKRRKKLLLLRALAATAPYHPRPAIQSDVAFPQAPGAEVFWFFFSRKHCFA